MNTMWAKIENETKIILNATAYRIGSLNRNYDFFSYSRLSIMIFKIYSPSIKDTRYGGDTHLSSLGNLRQEGHAYSLDSVSKTEN